MEGALAGADTGILGFCCPEHSSVAEVWILSQNKSIGHDETDQRSYHNGYEVFLRLYGADELKNGPKGAIWFYLYPAILHQRLDFQLF